MAAALRIPEAQQMIIRVSFLIFDMDVPFRCFVVVVVLGRSYIRGPV